MAAMVSVSPPAEAASRTASHGSSGYAASTANAAGTDSWLARLVPTRSYRSADTAPGLGGVLPGAVSIREVAHSMRVAMSAPATQWPLVEALVAASMASEIASGMVAPSMPPLTAAAT